MKNLSLYHIPIAYLILYTLAILFSGVWMFLLSQGLASSDILSILQKVIEKPSVKSLQTHIEIATPHIFAMGTLIFIISHFLLFSTKITFHTSAKLSLLLFLMALFNIFAFGWMKVIGLGLFLFLFLLLLVMLVLSFSNI
jgi:hypothetical protein